MKEYYIYRHIRLDKNEPFYIGVGTKQGGGTDKSVYSRAYDTCGRNKFWKNIYNKTDFDVEILFESHDKEYISEKEKEFIKIYGRNVLNKGVLTNIESGGYSGYKNEHSSVSIFCINDGMEYKSINDASKKYNISPNSISVHLANGQSNVKGFIFSKELSFTPIIEEVKLVGGEIKKKIRDHDYYLTNKGRVIRIIQEKIYNYLGELVLYKEQEITPVKIKAGFLQVSLSKKNKYVSKLVHKLVLEYFGEDYDKNKKIYFKDNCKTNASIENLTQKLYETCLPTLISKVGSKYRINIKKPFKMAFSEYTFEKAVCERNRVLKEFEEWGFVKNKPVDRTMGVSGVRGIRYLTREDTWETVWWENKKEIKIGYFKDLDQAILKQKEYIDNNGLQIYIQR